MNESLIYHPNESKFHWPWNVRGFKEVQVTTLPSFKSTGINQKYWISNSSTMYNLSDHMCFHLHWCICCFVFNSSAIYRIICVSICIDVYVVLYLLHLQSIGSCVFPSALMYMLIFLQDSSCIDFCNLKVSWPTPIPKLNDSGLWSGEFGDKLTTDDTSISLGHNSWWFQWIEQELRLA